MKTASWVIRNKGNGYASLTENGKDIYHELEARYGFRS